VYIED